MALMRSKLLGGALFAGALFGVTQVVEAPEQPVIGGGGHQKAVKTLTLNQKKQDVYTQQQREEDDLVLQVIIQAVTKGFL